MKSILLAHGLERPAESRLVGGVCAAIANRTDLHVMLVRLAALILVLASGLGIVLYLALWIAIPAAAPSGRSALGALGQGRSEIDAALARLRSSVASAWSHRGSRPWPRPLGRFWVGAALIATGCVVLLRSLGLFSWLGAGATVGLLAVVGGVAAIASISGATR